MALGQAVGIKPSFTLIVCCEGHVLGKSTKINIIFLFTYVPKPQYGLHFMKILKTLKSFKK